ncbi:MAG: ATPase [Gammaproteobacteria bacterium]|nr:ATPase [Gammaproteobacteria bacterium]
MSPAEFAQSQAGARISAAAHGVTQVAALRWLTRQFLKNPGGAFSLHRFHQDLRAQGQGIAKDEGGLTARYTLLQSCAAFDSSASAPLAPNGAIR